MFNVLIFKKMSVYNIKYERGAKVMCPVKDRESYMALRGSAKQVSTLKAVRAGDEGKKKLLVQMNYSCLPGENGRLKGAVRMSGSVGMDIDHLDKEEMAAVRERILAKREALGLLMLERSARGAGYHLVFRRKAELTQVENLRWASELLGVAFDKGAKDITRVFYTTTNDEEELLWLDDGLFEIVEVKAVERVQDVRVETETDETEAEEGDAFPKEYHGKTFEAIIAKYWELFNGGKEPMKGDRDTLTYQLACDLRHICGMNAKWLDAVIPCYDGFPVEEKRKKIANALQAKGEGMPYRLRQVLQAMEREQGMRACGGTLMTPPEMPKRLPPLLKLLTKNVPELFKPAVASAVFPALGAHMHGVKFRYWDNVEHEATFMHLLVGRQSVGKSCIKKPIEYIMEDIRQRDLPNRQREMEWKQRNPGAKQKKDPRPTDICIQMLIDNLTDAVFNQRVVDVNQNGERYIYTMVDEIDSLKNVTSKGTSDEVGLLIRKAFDNSLSGQERVGSDSVSGIAPLRWNFNASATPPNAMRFFERMLSNGTVSRLDMATIIRREDDDTAPVMGIYDQGFAEELKPYLERLEAASGLIECRSARKLSETMKAENDVRARLYDSEAYKVFSYRANVIAWLKGMVLYVAHGCKWSKEMAEFVRWSMQYNLWCKMMYFGQPMEREIRLEMEMQRKSGPKNLLELLPDEFSKEEYRLMRQSQGKAGDGESTLRVWCNRGYVAWDAAFGRYVKTEFYKGMRCRV